MDTANPTLDHPFGDAFEIEFRLDDRASRVVSCRTVGLADFGFPELLVRPDEPFAPTLPACPCGCPPPWPDPDEDDEDDPDPYEDRRFDDRRVEASGDPLDGAAAETHYLHVVRSAQMMSLLALDVLSEDTLDVLPRSEELLDLPVRFWLGEPELIRYRPPDGPGIDELAVPVHWVIE